MSGEVRAAWTWTGERFEAGITVRFGADGLIRALDRDADGPVRPVALLPGFINVHSHAFQRGLRGYGERFPEGSGSFWTWRERMYALVESVTADDMRDLAIRAFSEMRDAGITTVGEFHYLHHEGKETDHAFDRIMLEAAAAVGIRIVLLNCYYALGGFGLPLGPAQRRFRSESVVGFWRSVDALEPGLDTRTQSLGVAPHSVRAARIEDIVEVYQEARRRGFVFHMHVEEQRQEIDDCRRAHGATPMALLNRHLPSAEGMTAVHCTHTDTADLARYTERGGIVCLCPLTEGNLGDGIPALAPWPSVRDRLAFGTDSNLRLSMLEDMRWVEYAQRLRTESRGVLLDGQQGDWAPVVFRAATAGGAASLGVRAGRLAPGHAADMVAVDLDHPSLQEVPPQGLLEAIITGGGNSVIAGTWVAGRWRPSSTRRG